MSESKYLFKDAIVILDDDKALLHATEIMLSSSLQVPVFTFSDPHEALSHIRVNPTLLLLLDIMMPEMDGLQVATQVKKLNSHIPIYLVSANATRDKAIEGLNIGVNGIIDKPFSREQILSICTKYINEKQEAYERELREIEDLTESFIDEAKDLFSDLEQLIMRLSSDQDDAFVIDSLFRKVHSVKGAAGAIPNASHLAQLTHEFENVLSKIKQKLVVVDDNIIDVLLQSADLCHLLLSRIENRQNPTEQEVASVEAASRSLLGLLSHSTPSVIPIVPAAQKKIEVQAPQEEEGIYVPMEKLASF